MHIVRDPFQRRQEEGIKDLRGKEQAGLGTIIVPVIHDIRIIQVDQPFHELQTEIGQRPDQLQRCLRVVIEGGRAIFKSQQGVQALKQALRQGKPQRLAFPLQSGQEPFGLRLPVDGVQVRKYHPLLPLRYVLEQRLVQRGKIPPAHAEPVQPLLYLVPGLGYCEKAHAVCNVGDPLRLPVVPECMQDIFLFRHC